MTGLSGNNFHFVGNGELKVEMLLYIEKMFDDFPMNSTDKFGGRTLLLPEMKHLMKMPVSNLMRSSTRYSIKNSKAFILEQIC